MAAASLSNVLFENAIGNCLHFVIMYKIILFYLLFNDITVFIIVDFNFNVWIALMARKNLGDVGAIYRLKPYNNIIRRDRKSQEFTFEFNIWKVNWLTKACKKRIFVC